MTKLTIDTKNLSQEDIKQLEAIKAKADKPKWVNNWLKDIDCCSVGFTAGILGRTVFSKKTADYIAEQLEIYAQLLEAYVQVVGDWRPDWKDENQSKYYSYISYAGRVEISRTSVMRDSHGFYFPSRKLCTEWVDMIGHLLPKLGV